MTVRGGGVPACVMAFVPRKRMGPPPWSFAADAHDCIMVWVLGPTEYKVVGDWYAHSNAGSPLIVIPTPSSGPPCSELSRYGLASAERVERLVRRPTLTAPARAGALQYCGSGRRNRLSGRTKKPIKKGRKFVALKPLDNIDPIQGTSGSNREAESTDELVRGGLLRSSDEAG